MCRETADIIAKLSEAEIRETLKLGRKGTPLRWVDVLNVTDTSGFTEVMVLLDKQVEGPNTDGFSPGDIGRALERELRILLCTNDPKYKDLRRDIKKTQHSVRQIGIAIASVIASAWHLQAGLLTPFVLVFLMGVIKLGGEAWCSGTPIEAATGRNDRS